MQSTSERSKKRARGSVASAQQSLRYAHTDTMTRTADKNADAADDADNDQDLVDILEDYVSQR